ncbi:MAG: HipA domain-containing protein, partial [Treponema sp.]|nr:HipA domain-containing protein [Treponema sp.]
NGAPSTHIIKPSRSDFPDIAENEYLCMKLAGLAGLNAPDASLFYSEEKSVFVVQRYDRIVTGNGIRRVHQEDMCQALGIPSDRKYQADGGPSLKDIFALIKRISSVPLVDIKRFLEYVAFNFLIGNCDSHGKNFSVLYDNGKVSLAPLYDAVSTIAYPALTTNLSMKIGSRYEIEQITRSDFVSQAEAMGIKGGMMLGILDDMRGRLADAFKILHDDDVWKKNQTLAGSIEEHCKLLA